MISRSSRTDGRAASNIITPDEVDTNTEPTAAALRDVHGPARSDRAWSTAGVEGVFRFLTAFLAAIVIDDRSTGSRTEDCNRCRHDRTRRTVAPNDRRRNATTWGHSSSTRPSPPHRAQQPLTRSSPRTGAPRRGRALILLLITADPALAEKLWRAIGRNRTSPTSPAPTSTSALTADDEIEIPVSVNGELRARVHVATGADDVTHEATARADERIAALLDGTTVRKVVVVPGRLVNFVVG